MFCPQCGHENSPDSRFCESCGADLAHRASDESTAILTLDLAGFLGETFQVYRESFWPFVLISVVPQLPTVVSAIAKPIGTAMIVASVFLSILASGATVYAVAGKRLGRSIRVEECYRRAWRRVAVLTAAFVLYGLALFGAGILSLLLIGIPIFFYVAVVWFFADEAIMIEGMRLGALGRSADLVSRNWWRVFGIGAAYVVILLGAAIAAGLVTNGLLIISPFLATIWIAAVGTVLTPFVLIGRTLVYLDLRARKEGYSLDVLAAELSR